MSRSVRIPWIWPFFDHHDVADVPVAHGAGRGDDGVGRLEGHRSLGHDSRRYRAIRSSFGWWIGPPGACTLQGGATTESCKRAAGFPRLPIGASPSGTTGAADVDHATFPGRRRCGDSGMTTAGSLLVAIALTGGCASGASRRATLADGMGRAEECAAGNPWARRCSVKKTGGSGSWCRPAGLPRVAMASTCTRSASARPPSFQSAGDHFNPLGKEARARESRGRPRRRPARPRGGRQRPGGIRGGHRPDDTRHRPDLDLRHRRQRRRDPRAAGRSANGSVRKLGGAVAVRPAGVRSDQRLLLRP